MKGLMTALLCLCTTLGAVPALSCLLLVSCENYRFVAKRAEEFRVPAAELARLDCTTHNGKIELTGTENAGEVVVQAFLSARGPTPEEAELNLEMLEVTREVRGGILELDLRHPDKWWGVSPSVAFVIEAPVGRRRSPEAEERAADWLVDAWRHYAAACR